MPMMIYSIPRMICVIYIQYLPTLPLPVYRPLRSVYQSCYPACDLVVAFTFRVTTLFIFDWTIHLLSVLDLHDYLLESMLRRTGPRV
jgi:hypothetical protein